VVPERAHVWAQNHLDRPIASITPVSGGRTGTVYHVRFSSGDPVVLRYQTKEDWGEQGRQHITAEAIAARLLVGSPLPVARLIASDPTGVEAGGYANLTTWLPGQVRLDRLSSAAIDQLAHAAAVVHATVVSPDARPRRYEFWVPPEPVVPVWARDRHLWRRALELYAGSLPGTPLSLVHRDFHPGNVLWVGDQITGLIDWAETSWGPADLDVTHSRTNLAVLHSLDQAYEFSSAYARHGGTVDPDPEARRFWAVSDILGFLPDPQPILSALTVARPELTADVLHARLEQFLAHTLRQ
jgi:aminoglycoside phosphotransferase (APT) family kinase protein